MLRVGFVGWRGLVGSVLLERMLDNDDFRGIDTTFFSTSNAGGAGPSGLGFETGTLRDAYDLDALAKQDVIISCQGGDYTKAVHSNLRARWEGYWIDAASAIRMEPATVLVLDPINRDVIDDALNGGIRDLCGANCTVSLMLMALGGLFKAGHVEWMTSMTYQAASGAGAQNMLELARQLRHLGVSADAALSNPAATAIDVDRAVLESMRGSEFPTAEFGHPLAGSLLPFIDRIMPDGQSREEWKGEAEGNKILDSESAVPIDGQCVRVANMRCHSQAFTIKLNQSLPIADIEQLLSDQHEWVEVVPNTPEQTLARLTPAAVTGSLTVPVGRLRKMTMGDDYLTAFSVGDQLLWGAAEPVRRALDIVRSHLDAGKANGDRLAKAS